MPVMVPPVPTPQTKWVMRPRGLLPDLRAGGLVLGPRVVGVVVLVGLPGAGHLAGQPVRHRVVGVGVLGVDRRRAHDHLGAVGPQLGDLVGRHLVGADEDALVAAAGRHDGEPDAGVAAGRLDDRAAGLQPAVAPRRSRSWSAPVGPSTRTPGCRARAWRGGGSRGRAPSGRGAPSACCRSARRGRRPRPSARRRSVTRCVGTSVDGDVVVGVQHHGQPAFVELLGDRGGLGAARRARRCGAGCGCAGRRSA